MKFWEAKLVAWLHDPPEKALVLMRTPGRSHEDGTVRTILRTLFKDEPLDGYLDLVRRADRMAAAADRPDRPRPDGTRLGAWSADRIRFPSAPVLRHPLSGDRYNLKSLADVDPEHAEKIATDHLRYCLNLAEPKDAYQRFLRLWRLGPELLDAPGIRSLWRHLPADTRIPDHSIWDHLGLVSALAGAMVDSSEPALLLVTLGPVQSFIAQARTTSDLWAGSHLLARLSWEAMRPVVEECGPDAILFPALRGNPFCDAWLIARAALSLDELQRIRPAWKRRSDAHPLFAASLPNRFLAVVPSNRAELLAASCKDAVRHFAHCQAKKAWADVAEAAKLEEREHARAQIDEQLRDFPEVAWTCVRWPGDDDVRAAREDLGRSLTAIGASDPLSGPSWAHLTGAIEIDGAEFYRPNAGILYPTVVELAERVHAATRACRSFEQLVQEGYRCSLCGEREWLSGSVSIVRSPRNEGAAADPWPRVAAERPAWAHPGEHLCSICCLKRMWPVLFAREAHARLSQGDDDASESLPRFIVSTHTMALVPVLERLVDEPQLAERVLGALDRVEPNWRRAIRGHRVAIPRRLAEAIDALHSEHAQAIRALPAVVEWMEDQRDASSSTDAAHRLDERRSALLREVSEAVRAPRPETYYALLMLDGDRMGAWIAGRGDAVGRPAFRDLWHPDVVRAIEQLWPNDTAVRNYLDTEGLVSPGYHTALSSALGDLSLHVFPYFVERVFHGRLLYAGGDDLLAMFPVHELVPAMLLLRAAFSGTFPSSDEELGWLVRKHELQHDFRVNDGFVLLDAHSDARGLRGGRLFRTLGRKATCSVGAVIAHHSTPLRSVLTQLRAAEKRAKQAGRNAFCMTLDKRSGGRTMLVGHFQEPTVHAATSSSSLRSTTLGALTELQRSFSDFVSRQGCYNAVAWLDALAGSSPSAGSASFDMLASLLGYHLCRALVLPFDVASRGADATREWRLQRSEELHRLAKRVGQVAERERPDAPAAYAADLLRVAEFLSRGERNAEKPRRAHEAKETTL